MADISRNSFIETKNVLIDLRKLVPAPQELSRHYVDIQLQQGVPLLDSDWNEQTSIRRIELEAILAAGIGNGVPVGSNGFHIKESSDSNDFLISAGYLFCDGWLVVNSKECSYQNQPHRDVNGVNPALPATIENAAVARTELVYLDAWETEVDFTKDENLVNPKIGIETCVRLERVWAVRSVVIDSADDPLSPGTIADRVAGHRYYPLAVIDRAVGGEIKAYMFNDLRRTHLTLEALTHQPFYVYDSVRDQAADDQRLADAMSDNLVALQEAYQDDSLSFGTISDSAFLWHLMTIYNDLRAQAIAIREQAISGAMDRDSVLEAMTRFYHAQKTFSQTIVTGEPSTDDFLDNYNKYLFSDPLSLEVAVDSSDVLGSILAQERINHEIGLIGGSRLDGTVSLSLIGQSPSGGVVAGTAYKVTVHISSLLISDAGSEDVRVIAEVGDGWTASFAAASEPFASELVVNVANQSTKDIVLNITADAGAAATVLRLKVYPERRKLRVFRLPGVPLAIGSEIVAGATAIASLTYQGPPLNPGNETPPIPRSTMFNPGQGLGFRIENLAAEAKEFVIEITPAAGVSGWNNTPPRLQMASLASGEFVDHTILFKTSDQAGATSPQKFTLQLLQVNADTSETALPYTAFELTFNLA